MRHSLKIKLNITCWERSLEPLDTVSVKQRKNLIKQTKGAKNCTKSLLQVKKSLTEDVKISMINTNK